MTRIDKVIIYTKSREVIQIQDNIEFNIKRYLNENIEAIQTVETMTKEEYEKKYLK